MSELVVGPFQLLYHNPYPPQEIFQYPLFTLLERSLMSRDAYRTFRTHARFVPRRFVPKVEMIRTQR